MLLGLRPSVRQTEHLTMDWPAILRKSPPLRLKIVQPQIEGLYGRRRSRVTDQPSALNREIPRVDSLSGENGAQALAVSAARPTPDTIWITASRWVNLSAVYSTTTQGEPGSASIAASSRANSASASTATT